MNRASALERIQRAKRIVLKVGSNLLGDANSEEGIDLGMVRVLREEILALRERGVDVVLVSSGAVAMGREIMRGMNRPHDTDSLVRKQALSSIGQSRLMAVYAREFAAVDLPVAQLLLTARDFRHRRAYLNIGHTLEELRKLKVLPIVNENDAVSTQELRFGENDLLSAAVATLYRAELLAILTSVDGFYMRERRVPFLERISADELAEARGPQGAGTGGMQAKMRAAQLCLQSGEAMAILPGRHPGPVSALLEGRDIGTLICGQTPDRLSARKRWILYAITEGALVVDAGARAALVERGSSLLPAGIPRAAGNFLAGDVVEIKDEAGRVIGRGIVEYSFRELEPMLGKNSAELKEKGLNPRGEVIVHRNNLILEKN